MLAVQPTDIPSGVILELKGDITERDIEKIHELFILKSNTGEKVNALIVFDEWKGTSFRQFIEKVNLAQFIGFLNKAALVANSHWIKADANLSTLLPGVEAKHFEPHEIEEAKEWLDH